MVVIIIMVITIKRLIITTVLLVVMMSCGEVVAADPNYPDIVVTEFVRNYDADTITVNIKGWPKIIGENISIRINGIDAPEVRGGTEYSRDLAIKAKFFVGALLRMSDSIILKNPKRGKYFRIVADVEFNGIDLGKLLMYMGYAKAYDGKTSRPDWSKPE